MDRDKSEFLVCYDYGMGGLWGIFLARTADEITGKYPELVIVEEWPKWMTEADYADLRDRQIHEVDEVPWGILNALLADRDK